MKRQNRELHSLAHLALFTSSYLPLFILIIGRQLTANIDFLHFSGLSLPGLILFFEKFGLSVTLIILSMFGYLGYRLTFSNLEESAKNGIPVIIKEVNNKNSESIGYIATYIIPFLFQDLSGVYETLSIIFLLTIIYRIYINSNLILINPLLGFHYTLYEIKYMDDDVLRNGYVISKNGNIQEEERLKIYSVGRKLFYSAQEINK